MRSCCRCNTAIKHKAGADGKISGFTWTVPNFMAPIQQLKSDKSDGPIKWDIDTMAKYKLSEIKLHLSFFFVIKCSIITPCPIAVYSSQHAF